MFRLFDRYVSLKYVLLLSLESALIVFSVLAAAKLRFWSDSTEFANYVGDSEFWPQALTFLIIVQVCLYYNDLYNLSASRVPGEQTVRIIQAIGSACILLALLYYLIPGLLVGRGVLFISVFLVCGLTSLTRVGLDPLWRATSRQKNVLILGDGETALAVAREFQRRTDLNFRIAGFLTKEGSAEGQFFGKPMLGRLTDLEEIAKRERACRIVVALQDQRGALPIGPLVRLRVQGLEVEDATSALAALTGKVWLPTIRPSWFVFSNGFHRSTWTLLVKRSIDLAFGIVGLVLSAPVMALIALAIWVDSSGPVLFRQDRVGFGGRSFTLIKFRSMRQDAETDKGAQWAVQDDPRATRIGSFLRKYRLDELPQFLNVIRGDMSFVGPRPERPVFVEQLREALPFYDERHSIRPGVTGWAQVEYHYGSSLEDARLKLEYDLFYLKNLSIAFDLAIILKTARIVLQGVGGR